jgi:valyl-tRNA synthetase
MIGTTPGNDINISEAKIAGYRNFVNKLWNISRYILMKVKKVNLVEKAPRPKTLADKWMMAELNTLIDFATENLAKYNFSIVGEKIYEFTWSKLADWYVEVSKVEEEKDKILLYILQNLLKLWHPFCPFVTENIWQKLGAKDMLIVQEWPKDSKKIDSKIIKDFELIKSIVTAIRNLRVESKIPPAKKLKAVVVSPKRAKLIESEAEIIKHLPRLEDLEVGKKPAKSLSTVVTGAEIYLPISGMIDVEKEIKRLEAEAKRIEEFTAHLEQKLENQRFLERAPKEIIEAEKEKLVVNEETLESIKQQLKTLK